MKFRVERDVLAEAVTWVARGLPNRPPTPVLAGVMVEASSEGTLTLSAFDYEVSARISIPAEVSDAGTVLVLGKLLADISRNLPAQPVEVSDDGHRITMTCGSSTFTLQKMPTTDYPTLPHSPQISGSVDGTVFTEAVSQTAIAADRGDTLPILNGIRVEIEGENITMLATDRYRLASRTLTWNPANPQAHHVVLIPSRTLLETARSLGAAGQIDISLGGDVGGEGLVGFEAGSRRTTSRLLDGEYPKVTSIFPTSSETEAIVDTATILEAAKRVALVAERNTPIRLTFADSSVSINAGSGEDAQASEVIEATVTGPEIELAFNPGFLIDGLGVVGRQFSRFSFTQPLKPAVLTGQDSVGDLVDDSYRYILMPIRFAS